MSKTFRILSLLYGIFCYIVFLASFLYAIGFLGNFAVPKSIDSSPASGLFEALVINLILLSVFAIQHSVMARQWFKRKWTELVPKQIERSTYVLFSSLALFLIFFQWRTIDTVIWDIQLTPARILIYATYGFGWLVVLYSTIAINHFDLFGLRQVWFCFQNKEYEPLKFKIVFPYQYVRHPLYVGWFITFWVTPTMTVGHLLFAIVTSLYILVAVQFEEKDLCSFHPQYKGYKEKVPMLCPFSNLFKRND